MASKTVSEMISFSVQSSGSSSNGGSSDDDEDSYSPQTSRRRIQTAAIMYEFFEGSTESDTTLTYREKIQMRETINESIREDLQEVTPEQVTYTSRVVQLLHKYGDDFDKEMRDNQELWLATVEALREDTDSSQSKIDRVGEHLKTVILKMFERDENGEFDINPGRICSVFMYCYQVSKVLLNTVRKGEVANWLVSLAASLAVSFAKVQFYEWLEERGGWLKAIVECIPANPISRAILGPTDKIPNNLFLVGGLILIGIWANNTFIRN